MDGSVVRILDRTPMPSHACRVLSDSAQIMRARMLDEADSATSRGEQWSATVGPISVTLTPVR
ncbi:hypothetical protein [Streptomyces sp. NBC_01800]|uniref:hypothetical protein n=1 Tax=Streptomyces sp. NBC_01800 TaxID=2975945 RepID=UPI002DD82097|nr:hypothetical protein [Streptomyces sp. NBC_01800]WSA68775.1 hypothetical protein OIE65_18300 [Streptomyces sp. NBC_01800]